MATMLGTSFSVSKFCSSLRVVAKGEKLRRREKEFGVLAAIRAAQWWQISIICGRLLLTIVLGFFVTSDKVVHPM